MKATKVCPKCNSSNIAVVKGSSWNDKTWVPLSIWKKALTDRYICGSCGFYEEYVQLSASIKKWIDKNSEVDGFESDFV